MNHVELFSQQINFEYLTQAHSHNLNQMLFRLFFLFLIKYALPIFFNLLIYVLDNYIYYIILIMLF